MSNLLESIELLESRWSNVAKYASTIFGKSVGSPSGNLLWNRGKHSVYWFKDKPNTITIVAQGNPSMTLPKGKHGEHVADLAWLKKHGRTFARENGLG